MGAKEDGDAMTLMQARSWGNQGRQSERTIQLLRFDIDARFSDIAAPGCREKALKLETYVLDRQTRSITNGAVARKIRKLWGDGEPAKPSELSLVLFLSFYHRAQA